MDFKRVPFSGMFRISNIPDTFLGKNVTAFIQFSSKIVAKLMFCSDLKNIMTAIITLPVAISGAIYIKLTSSMTRLERHVILILSPIRIPCVSLSTENGQEYKHLSGITCVKYIMCSTCKLKILISLTVIN